MNKKIPRGFEDEDVPVPSWVIDEQETRRAFQQAEDDFRIRSFALDMAVTVLPSLTSMADNEDTKFRTLRRAEAEFEKILRGENES